MKRKSIEKPEPQKQSYELSSLDSSSFQENFILQQLIHRSSIFSIKKKIKTLTEFTGLLKTIHANSLFPPPCICNEKEQRIAFLENRDEYKVEAALYNYIYKNTTVTSMDLDVEIRKKQKGTISIAVPPPLIEQKKYYGTYGGCDFCLNMRWLINYIRHLFYQTIPQATTTTTTTVKSKEDQNLYWTEQMKESNLITIQVTRQYWSTHLQLVCIVLQQANLRQFNANHFFAMFMPIRYQKFEDLSVKSIPNSDNFYIHPVNSQLFFAAVRYFQIFHFTPDHAIPPVLFGFFWSALAHAPSTHLNFDQSYRYLSREILRTMISSLGVRDKKNKNVSNFYESGYEYLSITAILSQIILHLIEKKVNPIEMYQIEFIQFFTEMIQKDPFTWNALFRTKENATRFIYLLESVLFLLCSQDVQLEKRITELIRQGQFLNVYEIENWIQKENVKNQAILLLFIDIWKQVRSDPKILQQITSLPNNRDFFVNLRMKNAATKFKPTAAAFTLYLSPDPLIKHDIFIFYLVQFEGFHPLFWHTCAKVELLAMTPHGLAIETYTRSYLKLKHLGVSITAISPCKLSKEVRRNQILDKMKTSSNHEFLIDLDVSKLPWFAHETNLFQKLEKLPLYSFHWSPPIESPSPPFSPSSFPNLDENPFPILDITLLEPLEK